MIILAWDTSGRVLSVAILRNEKVIARHHAASDQRHSAELVPQIKRLLSRARVAVRDIDVLAVGLGPGSFTGLRVGLATAKILAYAADKRVIGVDSFAAAAHASGTPGQRIAVMRDARKGKVYGAVYALSKNSTRPVTRPSLLPTERFAAKAQSVNGLIRLDESDLPLAVSVGKLAFVRAKARSFDKLNRLEPLYLHPRDCNVTKKINPR